MVRIHRKLMDLFDQVLREYRGEPPVLADVVIERAFERFEPHLVAYFSDGHHALVAVQTEDVFQFCQRYSAWSVGRLRCALASEGRAIYAQMLASREASNNRGELGHREPRLAAAAPQPDAPRRLRDWWSWPRTSLVESSSFPSPAGFRSRRSGKRFSGQGREAIFSSSLPA